MSSVKAYKVSLFLPIIVPALFAPLFLVISLLGNELVLLLYILVFSGLVGGIPYSILVVLLFWLMRGKNELQIRKLLKFSPLLMLPIFWFFLAVVMAYDNNEQFFSRLISVMILYSPFVLLFGYTYVFVVFTVIDLFRPESR